MRICCGPDDPDDFGAGKKCKHTQSVLGAAPVLLSAGADASRGGSVRLFPAADIRVKLVARWNGAPPASWIFDAGQRRREAAHCGNPQLHSEDS